MPSKKLRPGDKCPSCFKKLTQWSFDEGRRRKVQNALDSVEKAKKNGTKLGPKVLWTRDEILALRKKGMSMRNIAHELGCSLFSVYRHTRPPKRGEE